MSRFRWAWAGSVVLLAGSVCVIAAETRPTHTGAHHGRGGLIKPYSELSSLSEEQKGKIMTIHSETVEKVHEIEAKEKADIEAILTDAQKKELSDIATKAREERHTTRSGAGPTTRP